MKNLIGNDWRDSSNLNVIEVINPATGSLIDTIPSSTVDDVVLTVNLAKAAQPSWEATPLYERADLLIKFSKILKENTPDLASVLSEESGKALKESQEELDYLYEMTLSVVEEAKHLYGKSLSSGIEESLANSLQFTTREALGVVGVILPYNFRMDILAGKIISALIMGNAVIVKPSHHAPLAITKIVYMLRQAGVYEGVVQVIHGDGKTVGQAIAMHPDVSLITFNGSTANGIRVMATCAKNLTKSVLSLGGNNAFILCKDADVDLAVNEAARSRFYNAGQLNTANKRFIVHTSLKEEFINKLIRKIGSIKLGIPTDKDTDLGCLISEKAAEKVEKQVNDMVKVGAKLVIGGRRNGAFYEPTIISDVHRNMPVATNLDILGPVVSIIEFESLNDAIDIANSSAYGNATSVFTRNTKIAMKVASLLKSGNVIINGGTQNQMMQMTSEGWKYSGFGKEGVLGSLEEVSKVKVIVLKDVLD